MKTWIPLSACIDGHLYRIDARNAPLGIYSSRDKSFIISRFKFNDNYIYEEEHWDCGEPHGTAKPLKDLGFVDMEPYKGYKWDKIKDKSLCDYLNKREEEECGSDD